MPSPSAFGKRRRRKSTKKSSGRRKRCGYVLRRSKGGMRIVHAYKKSVRGRMRKFTLRRGKMVALRKGAKCYKTKAQARRAMSKKRKTSKRKKTTRRRKKTTRRRRKKRSSFGSFGQGRADSLLQVMGPYPSSAFGRRRRAGFGSYGQGRANSLLQIMGPYPSNA